VLDVPFAVRRAVILRDQAEFHPRRYLLGLAEQFVRDGGRVYESTRATGVAEHGTAPIVRTTGGDIQAATSSSPPTPPSSIARCSSPG